MSVLSLIVPLHNYKSMNTIVKNVQRLLSTRNFSPLLNSTKIQIEKKTKE